jgi:hypothetical protein
VPGLPENPLGPEGKEELGGSIEKTSVLLLMNDHRDSCCGGTSP